MSRVIVSRRRDGVVQIRPRPLWRAVAGPVPAVLAGFLVACTSFLGLLAAALVRFPLLVLLVAGCGALALAAGRWALTEPRMAAAPIVSPRPPRDAA
ncbi:MAG TPA: hypothetical protein VFG59_03355 [Anaeromyxobacter sp.]|nr:hypothetical protein [Anaeromyxobacter sp.]